MTLIFAEHVHHDDEVHIAYNAIQTGWQQHPSPTREDASTFTQLFFEYSALIVIRRQDGRQGASSPTPSGPSSSASTTNSSRCERFDPESAGGRAKQQPPAVASSASARRPRRA